ncbi:uncharacterized protein LOC116618873 [Nematostella vectensis]|uniref:uncharacterized protein LOC116618873 n=1 Tax=Nematostella vectensis TaxID=45351 RepID=UPI00207765EC|nr:uncharacterized protein LOC116618873 [Nematostella vectensis]
MKIVKQISPLYGLLAVLVVCGTLLDQGECVINVITRGLVRKPQTEKKRVMAAPPLAVKVRRHYDVKTKQTLVQQWLKRVLRNRSHPRSLLHKRLKEGGLRSKTYHKKQQHNPYSPTYDHTNITGY